MSRHVDGVIPDNHVPDEVSASGLREDRAEKGLIKIDKPVGNDFLMVIKHPFRSPSTFPRSMRAFPATRSSAIPSRCWARGTAWRWPFARVTRPMPSVSTRTCGRGWRASATESSGRSRCCRGSTNGTTACCLAIASSATRTSWRAAARRSPSSRRRRCRSGCRSRAATRALSTARTRCARCEGPARARRRVLALLLARRCPDPRRSGGSQHVLFYRHFTHFTGGHLKVWDYFSHVRHSGTHRAHIRFTPESLWDESNPWWPLRDELDSWRSITPDVLFLEGTDWDAIDAGARARCPYPVLNLIQGVRHADPAYRPYAYLEHKAVRICVSEEVKGAILATERVRVRYSPFRSVSISRSLVPARASVRCGDRRPQEPRHGGAIARRILALMAGEDGGLGAGQHIGHELRGSSPDRSPAARDLPRAASARPCRRVPAEAVRRFLPSGPGGDGARHVGRLPDVVGNRSFCLAGQNSSGRTTRFKRSCARPWRR